MFGAIVAALPTIASAASAVGALGGGSATNKNDQVRQNRANAYLEHALAGDVTPARMILHGMQSSATAFGKQVYGAAWAELTRRNPAVAADAQRLGPAPEENAVGSGKPVSYETNRPTSSTPNPLKAEVSAWQQQVNAATANTVQRIGAGAATEAANKVQGEDNPYRDTSITIPTNYTTLAIIAGAIILLAVLAFKK